jgi:Ca-activated chloride channel homolog
MTALVAGALVVSACGNDFSDSVSDSGSSPTFGPESETATEGTGLGPSTNTANGDAERGLTASEAEPATGDNPTMPNGLGDANETSGGTASAPASGGLSRDYVANPRGDVRPGRDANTFQNYGVRPFVDTANDPRSTFALDVDTASYSIARRWVADGVVPPADSVRVEEYVNSFNYDYPAPGRGLSVEADAGPSPFDPAKVIVRLGVQAERVANDDRGAASLTFVVDTSGSMDRSNRLGLVKTSLQRLVQELDSKDSVAIVTYADHAQVLLPPTSVTDTQTILDAIIGLRTTGSTNLEAGLQRGYELARESFQPGGINRVVLASDGVANVGLTDPQALVSLIRGDADRGIQLVTVGVGMGNFNDVTMEQLADDGDGFYAYIDDETEARALFGHELISTLLTVALDAKIQVELDPRSVVAYRLLGFENRAVLDNDFRNDTVDAGELGAGHQATALYELTLRSGLGSRDRLGTVQLRWQDPGQGPARETRLELRAGMVEHSWSATDEDFRLAVTAAALAELLRGSPYVGDLGWDQVAREADSLADSNAAAAELARLTRRIQDLLGL